MRSIVYAGLMLGCLVFTPAPLLAADAQPPITTFFDNPALSAAILSPDGRHVALIAKGGLGRLVLAVVDSKEVGKVKVVANFDNADVQRVRWVNDNRLFFQISDLKDDAIFINGDGYAVNRDGTSLLQLTTGNWDYHQEATGGNIRNKILPAEYRFFSTLNDGSDDIVVAKNTFNHVDNSLESRRLYRLDTRNQKLVDMLEGKQPSLATNWVLDEGNQPRLAGSFSKGRYVLNYRDRTSGKWQEIANYDRLSESGFYPLFFDYDHGLYVSSTAKDGAEAIYKYDLQKKKLAAEPFLKVDGFDFDGYPETDAVAKKLVGIHFMNDASGSFWLDKGYKEIQRKLDEKLPDTVNTIDCGNCLSVQRILVASVSDKQPLVYYTYDIKSDELIKLGSTRPSVNPNQMAARDFVHFKARDGLSIPMYVTTPPVKASGPQPTVLLVHGGPHVRGGEWAWDNEAQFLASRGYVVLQPEFRGSTGFGEKHFKAGWKQWGLGMQDDLADAANWAIAQGLSDPKRIAIAGSSYGGYAALMGLIKSPELFRCGVSFAGVTDLEMLFTVGWSDSSKDSLQYDLRTLVGDPVKDAKQFAENSPLKNAEKLVQPLLMAYGAQDMRVPIVHGNALLAAVRKHNKQVEWIVYPDERHGLRMEKNRADYWGRVEAFLARNLAPQK